MEYKILKFGADWCGPCKTLNQKLENFKDCEVIKYDVDEVEEDLLEKYKIRNIPVTILVNENEEEIKRWIGLFNVNEITEKIKEING
jgi:thiol-disulfide isomerase/thioredoxin